MRTDARYSRGSTSVRDEDDDGCDTQILAREVGGEFGDHGVDVSEVRHIDTWADAPTVAAGPPADPDGELPNPGFETFSERPRPVVERRGADILWSRLPNGTFAEHTHAGLSAGDNDIVACCRLRLRHDEPRLSPDWLRLAGTHARPSVTGARLTTTRCEDQHSRCGQRSPSRRNWMGVQLTYRHALLYYGCRTPRFVCITSAAIAARIERDSAAATVTTAILTPP